MILISVLLLLPFIIAGYAYVGYPLLLLALRRRTRTPAPPSGQEDLEWPLVTVTLAAYNEQEAIAGSLEALLNADYPSARRQIIVISDASSDRTDTIVRSYAADGVELIRLPRRSGKTAAENAARGHIRGEIVVNTDASVRIAPEALKALVSVFADPSVGVASGRDVSVGRDDRNAAVGESGYVGYEMWVRDLETSAGGIVGASGCFYASLRGLHSELVPEALSRDFAAPLIAWERGYRSVSVSTALCFVPRSPSLRREYRRKVRTMARGLQTLYSKKGLMYPWRHGRFAWMLVSHKFVRWLVPWAVVAGGSGLLLLGFRFPWARWLLVGGAAVGIGLAAVAWWWPSGKRLPRPLGTIAYLLMGILAGLQAWIIVLRGEMNPTWEPTRR